MRYLGSKVKLLSAIEEVIKENNIEGDTFADLFAGTGSVGDFFKDRYKIISNDMFLFKEDIGTFKKLYERFEDDKQIFSQAFISIL